MRAREFIDIDYLSEHDDLSEIKIPASVKFAGKVIKHSPKIAAAAIGATMAAHTAEPQKPVKEPTAHVAKQVVKPVTKPVIKRNIK